MLTAKKRLIEILLNPTNSSGQPSVSQEVAQGSMSPTTDGSTSNDSNSSIESINSLAKKVKIASSGSVSPTTDSDLSEEELLESMNEKELRSVLSIDIWEDSKLVADFFRVRMST